MTEPLNRRPLSLRQGQIGTWLFMLSFALVLLLVLAPRSMFLEGDVTGSSRSQSAAPP